MIQVADNFNYRGKKPNFDRDSFDTLQDMKNYSENSLDDGHISYCKETNKHYKFNSNNQSDPTTGKWVEQHESVPADEEDITEQNGTLQLANKTYDKQSFSGLGRVYLRKNIVGDKNVLTQAMINKANIIYVIQYDYDLNGQTIVTPSNSILKFDGGSFDNGIVDISNTTDLINPKFNKNCKIAKDTILKDFVDVRTLGIYPDNLVKDIVKYIDYEDIPTLNMVANLGGVFIEYIKGKPVISGDMYVSKMGTTQERPANIINKGFQYFDTTINKPIFWDGAKWIDATGATV